MMANNKRMATAWAMLPEELMTEVLVRLPVKVILSFRAVCRRWAALVSSEEFCAAKEAAGSATETAKLLFLSPTARSDSTEVRSSDDGGMLLLTFNGMRGDDASITSMPCRGLTLLQHPLSSYFHVFNAATRAVTKLPPCEDMLVKPTTAGLGFDAKTKECKVVRLFSGDQPEERYTMVKCEVYTLGADCWRPISIEGVPYKFTAAALFGGTWFKLTPVFADGFLHWLIHPKFDFATRPAAAVLSFSVADETFSWVRSPPFDWEGAHLTELDGRLCMVRDLRRDSSLLEIWKVSAYGDWSLELRIDLLQHAAERRDPLKEDLLQPLYVRVVGKQGNKVFFATSKGKVLVYDPMSQTLEIILQLRGTQSHETKRSVTRFSLFKESLTQVRAHSMNTAKETRSCISSISSSIALRRYL